MMLAHSIIMLFSAVIWRCSAANNGRNVLLEEHCADDACVLHDEDLWRLHAWYFEEAKLFRLFALRAFPHDDYVRDYTDRFLRFVFRPNFERTIRINELSLMPTGESVRVKREDESVLTAPIRAELNRARTYSGDQEDANVIMVWDATTLQSYLHTAAPLILGNPRASYLLLFVKHDDNATCAINDAQPSFAHVLPTLWHEHRVLNAIALGPCTCRPREVFKYDPFALDNATQSRGVLKHRTLAEASARPFGVLNTLRSFRGAALNVTMFDRTPSAVRNLPDTMRHYACMYGDLSHGFGGFDGCVLGNLAHYLRFRINLVRTDDYGYQLANGSYVGSLGEVVYRRAEWAGNSRFMTALDSENIEFTTPVANDVACFIAPQPARMPQWIMIFRCFKLNTWAVIGAMMLALTAFLNVGWRVPVRNAQDIAFDNDLLKVYGISLGISQAIQTPVHHQRVILASCMIFNVIIASIFQGSLFTSFSRVSYYPAIDSLEALYDSGLPIATSVNVFQDGQSSILKKLKTRKISLKEKAINRTAFRGDVVAVERKADARFLMQTKFLSAQGLPLLHIVPECPSSYFLAYAMQKNSPYLPRLNDLLTRFLEAGLINKWSGDVINGLIMRRKISTPVHENVEKAFKFEDVQTAFYLLGVGVVAGAVAFAGELLTRFLFRRLIAIACFIRICRIY